MSGPDSKSFFLGAVVQLRTGKSVEANIANATKLIRDARKIGAEYIQTPEMTNIMEQGRDGLFASLKEEERDDALAAFRQLARDLKIYLHIGSLAIKVSHDKAANRGFLIAPDGEIVARYDKIHLFDVQLAGGESYRESNTYKPGEVAITADLPWGRLGMSICYDLRFPALYRALAGAGSHFLSVPAAFTKQTGEAHWHVLLRARAIETGCFVFAAAQGGRHENGRETYGHSLIIDPWGEMIGESRNSDPEIIVAEIDVTKVAQARARIPSLEHGRRFEVAGTAQERSHLNLVGKAS